MKFANKVFGEKLKSYLGEAGLKQKDLAIYLEVAAPTVSQWVTGEFLPEDDKFEAICTKLKKKPADFFGDPKGFSFSAASDFFGKIAGLSPQRRGLVLMLIHDDPDYLADSPALARAVSGLLEDE